MAAVAAEVAAAAGEVFLRFQNFLRLVSGYSQVARRLALYEKLTKSFHYKRETHTHTDISKNKDDGGP